MRLMNLMACTTAVLLGLSGNALACPTDSSSSSSPTLRSIELPPPPVMVTFTGELINMTDFAPPNDDAWRLQRPNRQIKLDVSAVRARARHLWNSRVTIQGHWSGPVGTSGRVFRVISIRRA